MIEASKMLVQASTTGGPASTCGRPEGRMSSDPSAALTPASSTARPAQKQAAVREATLDSGRAEHIPPAFAAFDTRIDHKLIAAARCGASDARAANTKPSPKVLQSAAARDDGARGTSQP